MIYLSDCLCLGLLVPGGSTVNPCHTRRNDNGDDWRSPSCNFPEIIICSCKHTCVPLLVLPCSLQICYLFRAVTERKNYPQNGLSAIISRTTSFSRGSCFVSFKATGCSHLGFPHFLKPFYRSGTSAGAL